MVSQKKSNLHCSASNHDRRRTILTDLLSISMRMELLLIVTEPMNHMSSNAESSNLSVCCVLAQRMSGVFNERCKRVSIKKRGVGHEIILRRKRRRRRSEECGGGRDVTS